MKNVVQGVVFSDALGHEGSGGWGRAGPKKCDEGSYIGSFHECRGEEANMVASPAASIEASMVANKACKVAADVAASNAASTETNLVVKNCSGCGSSCGCS